MEYPIAMKSTNERLAMGGEIDEDLDCYSKRMSCWQNEVFLKIVKNPPVEKGVLRNMIANLNKLLTQPTTSCMREVFQLAADFANQQ